MPNAASTLGASSTPSRIIASAPYEVSSAGWNASFTLPGRNAACSRRATSSPIATCPSCPEACIFPAACERYGTSFASSIGSASMSARISTQRAEPSAAPSRRPTTPVLTDPGSHGIAEPLQPLRHEPARAPLLEPQLGVLVEVAPRGDELGAVDRGESGHAGSAFILSSSDSTG